MTVTVVCWLTMQQICEQNSQFTGQGDWLANLFQVFGQLLCLLCLINKCKTRLPSRLVTQAITGNWWWMSSIIWCSIVPLIHTELTCCYSGALYNLSKWKSSQYWLEQSDSDMSQWCLCSTFWLSFDCMMVLQECRNWDTVITWVNLAEGPAQSFWYSTATCRS